MAEVIAATGFAALTVIICIHRRRHQRQVEYQRAIAAHVTVSRLTPDPDPITERVEFHFSRDREKG